MQFLGFSRNYSVIERAQAVAASPTVLFSDLTTTERRKIINWPTYDCITTISCGGDQYCGYNGEEVCGSICEDGLWVESQAVGGRRGGDVSAGVVLWFFCILFFFWISSGFLHPQKTSRSGCQRPNHMDHLPLQQSNFSSSKYFATGSRFLACIL